MEMALRTRIVKKMIQRRIEYTPEFKRMLPGGADSLSFLEVWGMPEGTIFNITYEYLKMIKQGIADDEIIKELEYADNQFENIRNTSVQPENIEEYIKLRIKSEHGEGSISDEFINSWIFFLPTWIEEEKKHLEIVQPQIDLIKELISENSTYMDDRLFDIIYNIGRCKPPLRLIKTILRESHDSYLALSNEIVSSSQNKMITIVNEKHKELSKNKYLNIHESVCDSCTFGLEIITNALDVMYLLESFYMDIPLRVQFKKNLEDINSLAKKYCVDKGYKKPKERLETKLYDAENQFKIINSTKYFEFEVNKETRSLNKIKRWHIFRSQISKERQIHEQTEKLNKIQEKSISEKKLKIALQQVNISVLQKEIKEIDI